MKTQIRILACLVALAALFSPAGATEEITDGSAATKKPNQDCSNYSIKLFSVCQTCPDYCTTVTTRTDGSLPSDYYSLSSVINNLTMEYSHGATELMIGSGSSAGCLSCGVSGADNRLMLSQLTRIFRSRESSIVSTLGRNHFLAPVDAKLMIYQGDGYNVIDVFDPQVFSRQRLIDGPYPNNVGVNDTLDGEFVSFRTNAVQSLILLDDTETQTDDLTDAKWAVLKRHNGFTFRFEVIDLAGVSGSDTSTDLELYLPLDETSGTTAADSSGNSRDGTVSGEATPNWTTGQVNGALTFDGTDDKIVVSGYKGVGGSSPRTVAAWIKTSSTADQAIVAWGEDASGQKWIFRVQDDNGTVGAIRVEINGGFIVGETSVGDGNWHHVAAVLPPTPGDVRINDVKLYVDGAEQQISDVGTLNVNTDVTNGIDVTIGSDHSNRYFNGDIDEVRLYSRALTEEEIRELADPTHVFAGRLVRAEDRNGYGLSVSYHYDPGDNFSGSPERQWQVDELTDDYNHVVGFTYDDTNQHGGRWVVTQITQPNGQTIDYSYTSDGLLNLVEFPDGTETSFSYTYNSTNQTTDVAIDDAAAEGTSRRKTVSLSNHINLVEQSGDFVPQAAGHARQVKNGEDEITYLMIPSSTTTRYVYEGTGKVKKLVTTTASGNVNDTVQHGTDWTYSSGTISAFTGESTFNKAISSNATNSKAWFRGEAKQQVDLTGFDIDYLFDSDSFPTKATYSDATTEEWEYNGFHQVTRYKDRLNRVTKATFDSNGNQLTREVGILFDTGTSQDVNQSEHATYEWAYYGASESPITTGNSAVDAAAADPQPENLLKTETDANGNVTDYVYDDDNFLIAIVEPKDTVGDDRAVTSFTYDTAGRLSKSIDPLGREVVYTYDERDRCVKITYDDDSTELFIYGTGTESNLLVKQKDRDGFTTKMEHDDHGRLVKRTSAFSVMNDDGSSETEVTDTSVRVEYTCTYLVGTNLRDECTNRGETMSFTYDFRQRAIETTVQPRTGTTLTSKTNYLDNLVFSSEDPYGRKSFNAYRSSDSMLIRSVQATVPSPTSEPTDFSGVTGLSRAGTPSSPSANAEYLITDRELDAEGQQFAIIDPRGVVHATEFDSRGRTVKSVEAATVLAGYDSADFEDGIDEGALAAIAAKTETIYDDQSNVIEVRSPRYFDSGDTEGYQKANTEMTYTGRNLLKTRTVAADSSIAATESFVYNLDRTLAKRTDFRSNDWERKYHVCCKRLAAQIEPLADLDGSGTKHAVRITNYSHARDVTHTALVKASTVPDPGETACCGGDTTFYNDPVDADTIHEMTVRFDERHRRIAQTRWLVPRGTVDPNDVPIAGGGETGDPDVVISTVTQGLTTRWFYDENLADNVGLSNSTGVTIPKLDGTGNLTVSIAPLLAILDNSVPAYNATEPVTPGGDVTFGTGSDGYAVVMLNPEDEVYVTIQDGTGRTVASGWIDVNDSSNPITYAFTAFDHIDDVDTEDLLETTVIDGVGHVTRSLVDGAGRTLKAFDAENNASSAQFDANSNQIQVRDPNSVGVDVVFDNRNRPTSRTDTENDTTESAYDQNNNVVTATDAKSEDIVCTFDARDRRIECTDRVASQTNWTYDDNNNLLELLDGDNQSGPDPTVYTYDARNLRITEAYPAHNPSSVIGDSDYDKRLYTFDAAIRNRVLTDQQGDTCTFTWDMGDRLASRDYSGHASGPLSGQSDTDSFEYDDASRMTKATRDRYTASIGDIVCDMVYDDAGRLVTESLTTRGETYDVASEWDAANRRAKITYPDDTVVDRLYTRRNQLETLKYETDTIDSREYDVGMRLDESTLENGIVTSWTYRDDDLVEQIAISGVTQFDYTYDANKNKTSELIDSGTGTMSAYGFTTGASGYDDEDRLVNWERDDTNKDQSWTLSLVGDWNSFTENATTETRTHDEPHQLTAISGGSIPGSLTYDAKGNLTDHSNGHDYAWNFTNMLESAVVGSGEPGIEGTHEYTYDALGRRVSKEVDSTDVTVFACAGLQEIAEYAGGASPSSPRRKYVYASYIDEPILLVDLTDLGAVSAGTEERFYYHCNNLYSIAAITDGNGNVYERCAYSAYGQLIILAPNGTTSRTVSAAGNPYTFTGRRLDDETGLHYFRSRYFSTALGRFVSRDPIGYVGGYGLYEFLDSCPTMRTDPTGQLSWTWDDIKCEVTMDVKVFVRFIGRWRPTFRRTIFIWALQQGTNTVWNTVGTIRIYPTKSYFRTRPPKPGVAWDRGTATRCPCPCEKSGWKPILSISASQNLTGQDLEVKAMEGSGTSFEQGGILTIYEDDVLPQRKRSLPAGWGSRNGGPRELHQMPQGTAGVYTQIPFSHEFGHWLGLDHPGVAAGFNSGGGNDPAAYYWDGPSLMGVGSQMRPEYYQKWADHLDTVDYLSTRPPAWNEPNYPADRKNCGPHVPK